MILRMDPVFLLHLLMVYVVSSLFFFSNIIGSEIFNSFIVGSAASFAVNCPATACGPKADLCWPETGMFPFKIIKFYCIN